MYGRWEILTNLSGGPVRLRNIIDNIDGDVYVGLCELTYVTGWINVSAALGNNKFSVRPSSSGPSTVITVPDGYYSVDTLNDVITGAPLPGFSATINNATGRITFTLSDPNYQLNLMSMARLWEFNTASWFGPSTTHIGDTTPTFFTKRNLMVSLNQINTSDNDLNGNPSTLLRHVPITGESYGESRTVSFDKVQYRRLAGGMINELTLRILDENNADISALRQPFSATLEIKRK
jgi:hypothetical protein